MPPDHQLVHASWTVVDSYQMCETQVSMSNPEVLAVVSFPGGPAAGSMAGTAALMVLAHPQLRSAVEHVPRILANWLAASPFCGLSCLRVRTCCAWLQWLSTSRGMLSLWAP